MPARLLSRKKLLSCSDAANQSKHLFWGVVTLGIVITGEDMAAQWTEGERESVRGGEEGSRLMLNLITVVKGRGRTAAVCQLCN